MPDVGVWNHALLRSASRRDASTRRQPSNAVAIARSISAGGQDPTKDDWTTLPRLGSMARSREPSADRLSAPAGSSASWPWICRGERAGGPAEARSLWGRARAVCEAHPCYVSTGNQVEHLDPGVSECQARRVDDGGKVRACSNPWGARHGSHMRAQQPILLPPDSSTVTKTSTWDFGKEDLITDASRIFSSAVERARSSGLCPGLLLLARNKS